MSGRTGQRLDDRQDILLERVGHREDFALALRGCRLVLFLFFVARSFLFLAQVFRLAQAVLEEDDRLGHRADLVPPGGRFDFDLHIAVRNDRQHSSPCC